MGTRPGGTIQELAATAGGNSYNVMVWVSSRLRKHPTGGQLNGGGDGRDRCQPVGVLQFDGDRDVCILVRPFGQTKNGQLPGAAALQRIGHLYAPVCSGSGGSAVGAPAAAAAARSGAVLARLTAVPALATVARARPAGSAGAARAGRAIAAVGVCIRRSASAPAATRPAPAAGAARIPDRADGGRRGAAGTTVGTAATAPLGQQLGHIPKPRISARPPQRAGRGAPLPYGDGIGCARSDVKHRPGVSPAATAAIPAGTSLRAPPPPPASTVRFVTPDGTINAAGLVGICDRQRLNHAAARQIQEQPQRYQSSSFPTSRHHCHPPDRSCRLDSKWERTSTWRIVRMLLRINPCEPHSRSRWLDTDFHPCRWHRGKWGSFSIFYPALQRTTNSDPSN